MVNCLLNLNIVCFWRELYICLWMEIVIFMNWKYWFKNIYDVSYDVREYLFFVFEI